ncbi:NAD-dependent epimerase/dehydratase family protein [Amycolatopsis sp. NPDC088138]|uniref:NAD-dependent epimerase/dehydratase family protein n=1 Tax=Amycolatopsis sp. NPDC088138 TaxID=3363938 RepID=UPI0038199A89
MAGSVLVTGGTGYVAGWCIAELLGRGYDVRATVRDASRGDRVRRAVATVSDRVDHLEFAVADLTADDGWKEAVDGCDYVLHVASPLGADASGAKDEAQALLVPARDGTVRVLRAAAAAGVRRVVMTSAANTASPSSYADDGVTDETLWTDLDAPKLLPYRRSKTAAELVAWEFMDSCKGPMTLATVLPGAVFGPVLSAGTLGSVQIIARLLSGAMPGTPRIGLEVVDVRDLADVHVRAMTAPEAAGQRFLATGEFLWMHDIARILRDGLGEAGSKAPTRKLPDIAVRAAAVFDRSLRDVMPGLGRRNRHSIAKAKRLLDWAPRPAEVSVLDCARSLIEHEVAGK